MLVSDHDRTHVGHMPRTDSASPGATHQPSRDCDNHSRNARHDGTPSGAEPQRPDNDTAAPLPIPRASGVTMPPSRRTSVSATRPIVTVMVVISPVVVCNLNCRCPHFSNILH